MINNDNNNVTFGFPEICLICAAYVHNSNLNYSFVFLVIAVVAGIFRLSYKINYKNTNNRNILHFYNELLKYKSKESYDDSIDLYKKRNEDND